MYLEILDVKKSESYIWSVYFDTDEGIYDCRGQLGDSEFTRFTHILEELQDHNISLRDVFFDYNNIEIVLNRSY